MNSTNATTVPWWGWIVTAFAAAFLVNTVPHSVMGLTGQSFPTPFSGGPGTLSSALVNILWGMFNLAVGLWLCRLALPWRNNRAAQAVFVIAGAAFAVLLAIAFSSVPAPVA